MTILHWRRTHQPTLVFLPGKVKVKSLSRVRLFATPWTVAYQACLSMGFSRQEYWRGLPFPSPGDLPDPGIEPGSPALWADALPSEPPGKHACLENPTDRGAWRTTVHRSIRVQELDTTEATLHESLNHCLLLFIKPLCFLLFSFPKDGSHYLFCLLKQC